MLVLVADDHPDVAHLQATLLKQNGYETEVCVHGNQVMEAIERTRPDVVLLDLTMPGMDGFDVAEELEINADLRPTLLVAVTGHHDEMMRKRTRDAGFDHHLLKPVSWSDLAPLLESVTAK